MAIAADLFPAYNIDKKNVRKHIFESALHNPNIIVHTVGLYVMYPMLEYCAKHHPDEVPYMYRDALSTDMAWLMIEKLDAEKIAVLSALGCDPIPYLDACLFRNEKDLTQDPNNPHLWYANGVTFTNGEEFLIRPNDDWGNGLWRYTGSDELFGQGRFDTGGDNFPFNAPTGSYDVWFNDLDGSYVIIPN